MQGIPDPKRPGGRGRGRKRLRPTKIPQIIQPPQIAGPIQTDATPPLPSQNGTEIPGEDLMTQSQLKQSSAEEATSLKGLDVAMPSSLEIPDAVKTEQFPIAGIGVPEEETKVEGANDDTLGGQDPKNLPKPDDVIPLERPSNTSSNPGQASENSFPGVEENQKLPPIPNTNTLQRKNLPNISSTYDRVVKSVYALLRFLRCLTILTN